MFRNTTMMLLRYSLLFLSACAMALPGAGGCGRTGTCQHMARKVVSWSSKRALHGRSRTISQVAGVLCLDGMGVQVGWQGYAPRENSGGMFCASDMCNHDARTDVSLDISERGGCFCLRGGGGFDGVQRGRQKGTWREDVSDVLGAWDMGELLEVCKDDGLGWSAERSAQGFQRLKQLSSGMGANSIGTPADKVCTALTDRVRHVVDDLEPRHIGMILNAHAARGKQPEASLMTLLEKRALHRLRDFNNQEVSNLMWACAKLDLLPQKDLIKGLLDHAYELLDDFAPQGVVNLVWACARIGVPPDDEVLQALLERAVELLWEFNAQDSANLLWACATLNMNPGDELLQGLLDAAVEREFEFKPQGVANLLWACATLGIRPGEEVMRGLLDPRPHKLIAEIKPQEISNLLWACATMDFAPREALLQGLLHRAVRLTRVFNPQNIANLLWACAKLDFGPADALIRGLFSRARDVLGEFRPQEVSNLLWACAKLNIKPEDLLLRGLCDHVLERTDDFTLQGIANVLWACATLNVPPRDSVLRELFERARTLEPDAHSPQGIFNLLWGCAVLGRLREGMEMLAVSCVSVDKFLGSVYADRVNHLAQLHQFLLSVELSQDDLSTRCSAESLSAVQSVRQKWDAACRDAFSREPNRSDFQRDVTAIIKSLGIGYTEEATDERSCYSIDVLMVHKGLRIALEVDGPTHYLGGGCEASGATVLKRRHLLGLGYETLSVPYFEWQGLGWEEKEQYVRHLLGV